MKFLEGGGGGGGGGGEELFFPSDGRVLDASGEAFTTLLWSFV
jgi:hypothetical protein